MAVDLDGLLGGPVLRAFGEAGTLRRGARSHAFTGVFDRFATDIALNGAGQPISVSAPRVTVRLAEFPADLQPQQGDTVMLRGGTWKVLDASPDGFGTALLALGQRPLNDAGPA